MHLLSILLFCFQVCCCICCKWFILWKFILVILADLVFLTSQIAALPPGEKCCDWGKHIATRWTILFCWEIDHENNSSYHSYESLSPYFFFLLWAKKLLILRPSTNKRHSQNIRNYSELLFKCGTFLTFTSMRALSNSKSFSLNTCNIFFPHYLGFGRMVNSSAVIENNRYNFKSKWSWLFKLLWALWLQLIN